MTDAMLVQEYAQSRSSAALAELASRHRDWVYSAALRMVGDADMAQDVTQAVFLVLVQKAGALGRKPVNAWLFNVTRYAAKHALRDRARRNHHERRAVQMIGQLTASLDDETWKEIAPLLDKLVGRLKGCDRQAILLRFYEGKSMSQIGVALSISEDAAKKRVAKAVRRLRELLSARGVGVGDGALGSVMLLHTTHAAPPPLGAPTAGATSISMGVITMMAISRLKLAALVALAIALIPAAVVMALQSNEGPPATRPQGADLQTIADQSDDAVALYIEAEAAIKVQSPASMIDIDSEYHPDSAKWRSGAAAAWEADGRTRELAHQARSLWHADWTGGNGALGNMNHLLNLTNNLSDAAVYANSQGNAVQAVEIIRDLMHLSNLLANSPSSGLMPMIRGKVIELLTGDQVMIIAAGARFTNDPLNTRDLQVQTAHELIAQLRDHPNSQALIDKAKKDEHPEFPTRPTTFTRALEMFRRGDAEYDLAAMSLASHLFKFEKNRWPNSLDELIPAYLPTAIVDPWGDGKQPLGYGLVKGGLPDGSDRPLVFFRLNSSDGLCYLVNTIYYSYYFDDGSDRPHNLQKHYGVFLDVTHWQPIAHYTGPATQPLPPEALQITPPSVMPAKD
jgi:RNA polymerase sigma factor (sigma-70 family)